MSTSTHLISLLLTITLVTVAASASVVAQESEAPSDADTQRLLEEGVVLYNDSVGELDVSFARSLIAGRTASVYVEDGSKTQVFSVSVRDDMRIKDLSAGPDSRASTQITTDRETLETIAESSEPMSEVRSALSDDRIRVNGERGHPADQVARTAANTFRSFSL